MSEIEAAITVAGAIVVTLIGSYIAYILSEQGAARALKQEVALRPYVDRVTALKAVYVAMMDCAYLLNRSANNPPRTLPEYQEKVGEPLDEFTRALYKNGIWLSKVESKLLNVLGIFRQTALAVNPTLSSGSTSVPWLELLQTPSIAGKAIADELGIDILEQQLNTLMSGLRVPTTSGATAAPQLSQTPNPNPNRDIDLLKINLASDYRLGWLVAFIGVYFALIVGLMIAWYQKNPSNYFGYYIIAGVFGSLLATQELLPYKRWLKQVDGWLKAIESNERIPELTQLVRQRDNLKSTGHAILIFLILFEFYLSILGYSPLEVFLAFLAVGAVVVFLTDGGIPWIRKRTGQIPPKS